MATTASIAFSGLLIFILLHILKCEQICVPLTSPHCNNAGYTQTAKFPPINGQPYQAAKGHELQTYLQFLRTCSAFSETILCSLIFPKCDPSMQGPHLPCRSVCNDFVSKCSSLLDRGAVTGIMAVLCDLLPVYNGDNKTCFLPKGFNISTAAPGDQKGRCYKITVPKCSDDLHYNTTFYNATMQANSNYHLLQPVIDSNCSTKIEKYTCFSRLPPCYKDNNSIQVPCRSLCKQVSSDCKKELADNRLQLPDCDLLYPNGTGVNDLCKITKWPAPWTNGTHVTPTRPPTKPPTTVTTTKRPPTTKPVSKKCSPITIKSCKDAGYSYTFKYPDIGGKSYQAAKSVHLDFYVPLLKCSKLAPLVLCSMYVPKCTDKYPHKAVLPCRQVCYQFVKDCHSYLKLVSIFGLFTSICDLLPIASSDGTPCFVPPGFTSTAGGTSKDVCHPVIKKSKCLDHLHYNQTFLQTTEQASSEFTLMQQIIDTRCSPDVEKFFCFTRLPPCNSNNDVSVLLPCRSMCERVVRDCKGAYKKTGWQPPDCDFLLPNATGENGLCQIKRFPVPLRHIVNRRPTTLPPRLRRPKKSHAGVIAGVVVTLIIVIIGAGLLVYYFKCYRNRHPFAPQVFHNVQTTDNYDT